MKIYMAVVKYGAINSRITRRAENEMQFKMLVSNIKRVPFYAISDIQEKENLAVV